jgi:peroxiredoxin Q/BCP
MKTKHVCLSLFLYVFSSMVFALEVGDKAPDFELEGTVGHTYTLSQFKDKETVVLAWFPKAYTRGCTIECKSLADNGHLLKKFNASYFMASVDPVEDNKGFAAEQNADFPLLSDPSKATARAYGVLSEERGVAMRHTFYINPEGIVVAIDRSVQPETSAEDMARTLAELGVEARQ